MAVMRLDHVQLAMPAGREEEAVAFYEGLLGIPRVPKPERLAARGGCWFESGDLKVHLGVEADFRPARKAHPAFVVGDVRALARALAGAGHVVVEDEPLAGHDRVYVDDPFGNRIELLQPVGPSARPNVRAAPAVRIARLGPGDERAAADACRRFGAETDFDPSAFLSEPRTALLVAMDEDPVGWAYGHELVHPDGDRTMLLYALDVAEGARGRGIGTDLVRAFVGHARTRRCNEVWVLTEDDNRAAIATYLGAGGTREPGRSAVFSWPLGSDRDG